MSKKRIKRKSKRRRHRDAVRRARTATQRHAGRRRPSRATSRREPFQSITITRDGGFNVTTIPDGEIDAYHAYLKAHDLLPPGHDVRWPVDGKELAMAVQLLEDPRAGRRAALKAIMILAHMPDERALAALMKHAESGRAQAAMAKHGAAECRMWLEERVPALSPPGWTTSPQNAAMLN